MAQHTQAVDTRQARKLNGQDYKTLALAALGGALEFYDFIIFVFFAAVIGNLFFPPQMPDWLRMVQTFGIFAAGYLARPLGGVIMAHFGDLFGRKRMFSLSIFLMALPTLFMGLLPTYGGDNLFPGIGIAAPLLLLFFRVMQGAAIGGEVPGAWVFVAEHVPQRHVGFACGTLTSGLTAGILIGSLVATAINASLTQAEIAAWGWRMPFILGGVFGMLAMYLRRWLHETPVFTEMQARKKLAAELPLKAVVRQHKTAVVVGMLLTWLLSAGIVVMILLTPTVLQKQFGVTPLMSLEANSLAIVFLSIGCIVYGSLCDRLGAGRTFIGGSLLLGASSLLFYYSVANDVSTLYSMYALAGFSVGVVGAVPFVMVNAFPAEVRFSGLSFSYNVAYAIFGGLTPICVTLMMKVTRMAPAYYVLALAILGLGIGCYLLSGRQERAAGQNAEAGVSR